MSATHMGSRPSGLPHPLLGEVVLEAIGVAAWDDLVKIVFHGGSPGILGLAEVSWVGGVDRGVKGESGGGGGFPGEAQGAACFHPAMSLPGKGLDFVGGLLHGHKGPLQQFIQGPPQQLRPHLDDRAGAARRKLLVAEFLAVEFTWSSFTLREDSTKAQAQISPVNSSTA